MKIRTMRDISSLGTIMCIAAHPDDETILCGGIMAAAARNGQRVICVTATRGEAGVQDARKWPAKTLGQVRTAELETALDILGDIEHIWLGYRDGFCASANETEAVQTVTNLCKQWHPDTVLTFGPDGLTGHDDHRTVSLWAAKALQAARPAARLFHKVEVAELYRRYLVPIDEAIDLYFNIQQPPIEDAGDCDICFRLPADLVDLKLQALRAMPSQTEGLMTHFPRDFLAKAFGVEAFVRTDY